MCYTWINKNLMHQVGEQTKVTLICTVNQPSTQYLGLKPGKEETLWEI
jgi:hypothetical protein